MGGEGGGGGRRKKQLNCRACGRSWSSDAAGFQGLRRGPAKRGRGHEMDIYWGVYFTGLKSGFNLIRKKGWRCVGGFQKLNQ